MEDVVIDSHFWQGRKVFVTGHTGFKGGWICLLLQAFGAEVYGFALAPPTTPSLFDVARIGDGMVSVIGDVRDGEALEAELKAASPDLVVHMAAQPLVRYSYANPTETYATNVLGTVHLLEAVRSTPSVRAVVIVTTDKCYENREWDWGYRESDGLGGVDPYSSSKACVELVAEAFRRSYFCASPAVPGRSVALATARAGNVIGGGDWAIDRLIPDMVRSFRRGEPVEIRNPRSVRPWQHVLEPLRGYLMLAERLFVDGAEYAEAWNFGPSDEDARPVEWLVQTAVQLWGPGASWSVANEIQPHETRSLRLDSSKARTRLGWRPSWQLEKALGDTMAWYSAFDKGADMRAVTFDQIRNALTPSLSLRV
jgi:CDP-glucose 4,6-dehydratase